MKKRVLAAMMMGIMVFGSVMCASAAPSKTDTITVVTPSGADTDKGSYVILDSKEEFQDIKTDAGIEKALEEAVKADPTITEAKKEEMKKSHKEAAAIIEKVDKGQAVGKDVKINDTIDKQLKDKKVVKAFFDLHATGDKKDICLEDGKKHTITLNVSDMTTSWKNIVILHYSTIRAVWETIVPKVDYDKKTLTFEVEDLSPLAIYADIVEDDKKGEADATEGVSSTWMLYSAMALIVLGACVVVSQKKKF